MPVFYLSVSLSSPASTKSRICSSAIRHWYLLSTRRRRHGQKYPESGDQEYVPAQYRLHDVIEVESECENVVNLCQKSVERGTCEQQYILTQIHRTEEYAGINNEKRSTGR